MNKLRIHVYTLCYNESHFVKNFLAGYKDAERIIVYDNMSTDGSQELLLKDPRVEIREYDSDGKIRDDLYLEMKNYSWKEARGLADWVIVVDFDEILVHVRHDRTFDLDLYSVQKAGFNMIKPYGYNMISMDAPLGADGHPFEYSKVGTYHAPEEKLCCFKPEIVGEMNFTTGAHWAAPVDIHGSEKGIQMCIFPDWKLLHFKFWNFEHYMKRMAEYQGRLSQWNRKMGAGWHYTNTLQWHEQCYKNGFAIAKNLFDIQKPE